MCSFLNSKIYFGVQLYINKITGWSFYLQAHPWFKGIEWDKLYQMKAAFIPEVNDELDTQNFEKFEEVKYVFMLKDTEVFFSFVGADQYHTLLMYY